jgi:hypothetical protein
MRTRGARGLFVCVNILFFSSLCFSQHGPVFKVLGRIPDSGSSALYQIQVGAFRNRYNAEKVFEKLDNALLNPVYEEYLHLTRVMAADIATRDVPGCLEKLRGLGFTEVIIREDAAPGLPEGELPVSTAALPSGALKEIGYRVIRTGETRNLAELAVNKNISSWKSSTPSVASVNSRGDVTGLHIGNAFVQINETEYMSVVVVPAEPFYIVDESEASLLPESSKTGSSETRNVTEYRTEPTFRLAYRFNNKGEFRGASGENGGIDILGRGKDYEWLWTTYYQGGWFYDLNGIKREMVNGYQKDTANGVELLVQPEFVYDNGVPYLQLRHILRNMNGFAVSGQRFGASADVMIHRNDFASLVHTSYGAYMTDSPDEPTLELMFVAESGDGITPVDTLWLGTWGMGMHLMSIYDDDRDDVHGRDSAIGFSYKNISLGPGETKEFIVRFTLVRNENAG